MALDRRSLLKTLVTAGATAAATPAIALAREPKKRPADARGLLYDATRCVGCKACMTACREANGLEPDARDGMYDDPLDLNGATKNVIKLYQTEGGVQSFMKMQCMQCVDPGCASVCMLGAFKKDEFGIVSYDADRCVGCRYCQVACPFNVPKFEWSSIAPKVVKCELCRHRIAEGKIPACAEVCPRDAVTYGAYQDLLTDAKARIAANPNRYNPHIYGETEGGGTQVLYLSAANVPFTALGLPDLGEHSVPSLPETIQHTIYKGFAAPVALYAVLGTVVWRNHRKEEVAEEEASS